MTTTTKARPILFSAEMIRALLENRKRMTRRLVKFNHKPWLEPLPHVEYARDGMPIWWTAPPSEEIRQSDYYDHGMPCPYGRVGDVLWCRETWQQLHCVGNGAWVPVTTPQRKSKARLAYAADGSGLAWGGPWRPSIFMPKWASRITLEITGVRVERVQAIGKDGRKAHDVLAEGITPEQIAQNAKWFHKDDAPALTFSQLWNKINGAGSWMRNDWTWVVSFRRIEQEQGQ